jgi:hypothetical protein
MVKARGPRACGLRGAGKGGAVGAKKRIRKWTPGQTG